MEKKILNHKYYLYLTEFFAGMAVMAVELGASRLLAPYFSSSQIVWTIIIGTIMIAMALGNVFGGRSADKNPNPDKLYIRIIIAAIWIAAIPVVGKYIILGISGVLVLTVNNNFLTIAAFIACMVIFVFPLFLLGTVTPSLVKYTVESLDDSGKTVGTLGAFNTIGSILGTFLPTFVTIPAVGTAVTFLIFSGILLLLGIVYFISSKSKPVMCIVSIVIFIGCGILGNNNSFAFWESNLAYEGESVYNYLQVKETEESTILSTNVLFGVQSITMKEDTLTGMYYDYAMAAPVIAGGAKAMKGHDLKAQDNSSDSYDEVDASDDTASLEHTKLDVLILGMGTGTYARQCERYFDNMKVEGVEIDDKITALSNEYFDASKNATVTTYDGRAYLQAVSKKYDVIMVDAYQDITIPFQMSTVEFFTMVKEHLSADGVMVVNMNMHSDEKGNINEHLSDTIASVFSDVYTVDVPGNTSRELFATSQNNLKNSFEKGMTSLSNHELRYTMNEIGESMVKYQKGNLILTDDKAPVELLGMSVIDDLIQDEIGYYKDIFKKDGISGILEEF